MFKLIGFLVGVGLMVLAAMAWLDEPQAKKVSSQLHQELDQVIEQVAQQQPDLVAVSEIKQALPEAVQTLVDQAQQSADDLVTDNLAVDKFPIDDALESNGSWHIFWHPFKRRQSAEGFASRLSLQTGIEITVVADETGLYRVNFAYSDEADKQRILQLIEGKTGLQVLVS